MENSTRLNGSKMSVEMNGGRHMEGTTVNKEIKPITGKELVGQVTGQRRFLQYADDEIKESGLVEVDTELRQRGLRICKEFLAGSWKDMNPNDFHMDRIQ